MTKQEATDAVNDAAMEHGPAFVIGLLKSFLRGSAIALKETKMDMAFAHAVNALNLLDKAEASARDVEAALDAEAKRIALDQRPPGAV